MKVYTGFDTLTPPVETKSTPGSPGTKKRYCRLGKGLGREGRMRHLLSKVAFAVIFAFLAHVSLLWSESAIAKPVEIVVGVSDSLAPRIIRTWQQYPDACAQDEFFSAEWLRTTLEFFILCRAVRLGGIEATYSFKNYPNSARTRVELKKGTVMIMVDFPWGDFANDESLYKSTAVLPVGSFVKGLYTRPDHKAVLSVKSLEELRKFRAASSRNWLYDWEALERMGVPKVSVPEYVQMGMLVLHGRADYFVGEFPGADDLSQYINGKKFIPVPGLKVVLPGSRHVALSKKFPHSKQVFDALQVGLYDMRARGLIQKGYRKSGFFNPKVEHWEAICCD